MRELRTLGQRQNTMRRRSAPLLVLLLAAATACGSTTDTVDSVEDPPTTPSERNDDDAAREVTAPPTSPPPTDTAVSIDTAVSSNTSVSSNTVATEDTAITQISPQAVPSLSSTLPERPRDTTPGSFPLDPASARVQATVADLADRLGISASAVTVVEASAVTWGDSSLGCPQPGMRYLQRVTDGSLVVLRVDGVDYRYTGGDPLTLCGKVNDR